MCACFWQEAAELRPGRLWALEASIQAQVQHLDRLANHFAENSNTAQILLFHIQNDVP